MIEINPLPLMKKILKAVIIIILLFGLYILRTVWQSGSFKTIKNNFSGTTQRIEGFPGVEDITIDQSTGIAFLSSDDRWSALLKKLPVKGAIYKLNLNDSVPQPVILTDNFKQDDFHPHGISLFQTPEGKKIIFVVNHRRSGNFIERFEYKNDSLDYKESISGELIISPNDVVGVGERAFYFTNDHNEKISGWRTFKDLLTIGTGNVCYYDGDRMNKTSIEGIKYANGVNVSHDGKKLYVAATTDLKILIYDRELTSGVLTKSNEIDTNTGVDNIELDADGNLWVGCHPQLLKFLSHSKDETLISPSEIIKLTDSGDGKFLQQTIYINDGSEISASSVGVVYKKTMLIGPVFQRHIIIGKKVDN